MHTENNQKNLREENLSITPKTEFFGRGAIREQSKSRFFSGLIRKPRPEETTFQKLVLKHRKITRQKILSNQLSWPTIFAFLPLGVGLFQFFTTPTTQFRRETFFQKTIPIIANLNPKFTAETIQYILKSDNNSRTPTTGFLASQPRFLTLKKGLTNTTKITSFLDFERVTGLSYLFFDELPSYLQGLANSEKNQNFGKVSEDAKRLNFSGKSAQASLLVNNVSKSEIFGDLEKTNQTNSNVFKPKKNFVSNQSKNLGSYPISNLFDLDSHSNDKKEPIIQCVSPDFQETSIASGFANSFFKERLHFLKTEDELNREIQALFIEEEILLPTDFEGEENESLFQNFLKQNRTVDETILVDKVLKKSTKSSKILFQEGTVQNFRLMSGYIYPDMKDQDLEWFFRQQRIMEPLLSKFKISGNVLFDSWNQLKPSSILIPNSSNQYKFEVTDFPKILIQTQPTVISDPVTGKIVYDGPSLVLDQQTALDWKTSTDQNLRSWFHQYISPLNPFTHRQENFFGLFQSPKFSNDFRQKNFSAFQNTAFLHDAYSQTNDFWFLAPPSRLKSLMNPVLPSIQIPNTLDQQKSRLVWSMTVPILNEEGTSARNISLPILQIRQPLAFQTKEGEKQRSAFTEKVYSPMFDLGLTAKPDLSFSAEAWNFTAYTDTYSGSQYKRKASIFSTYTKAGWLETWEPLSANAWLILCQVSFAVLSFHLLKTLAGNYGQELVGYLLELAAVLGFLDDSAKQQIEIILGQRTPGYRVVPKTTKTFQDVVGVEQYLPELYEVIWFLRNSGRDFVLSQTLPRGILLTGPPGTGKTLLVQAIAGEAGVPVVVLSGSSLIQPGESAVVKLDMVFQEARSNAPCIVFIDELDTLGQSRSGIVQSPMDRDDILDSVISSKQKIQLPFIESSEEPETSSHPFVQQNPQQLGLLTKLLIELDGMQGRDGVIVFGATNRPEALDPALLRPGRFDKVIEVGLPHQEKRIEILQFYAKNRGSVKTLPWDYLAARTIGFSAADLATLMNESAMKAIMAESQHTVETIEHGLDRLTTSEIEKISPLKKDEPFYSSQMFGGTHSAVSEVNSPFSVSQKLEIVRLAYYQAAKVVVTSLLTYHPTSVVACLWPRRPTLRSVQLTTNLQNTMFQFSRLYELHDRLVGCYAGKAAEFLFVQKFSSRRSSHLSTIGLEDLAFAQKILYSLVEKGSFYSKKTHFQKTLPLVENLNFREFRLNPEKIDVYEELVEKMYIPPMEETLKENTSSLTTSQEPDLDTFEEQFYYSVPWWQQETSKALEFLTKNAGNWSHLYLSNPEMNERNVEWVPPDEFYHTHTASKYVRMAFLNVKRTQPLLSESGSKKDSSISSLTTSDPSFTFPDLKNKDRKPETSEIGRSLANQRGGESEKGNTVRASDFVNQNPELSDQEKIYPNKKVNLAWNDVSNLTRDYPVHSLVLQSFNKAFKILNQNRELLDRLVIELISHEIVRQPEIMKLVNEFHQEIELLSQVSTHTKSETQKGKHPIIETFEKENQMKIVEFSWGSGSRKPVPRWIDFTDLSSSH